MDVIIRLSVPKVVYGFYKGASDHISERTAESLMAEVLCMYAKSLSKDVENEMSNIVDKIETMV